MQYNEFIHQVGQHTHLDAAQAETLARAVIETLGERLDEKTRQNVQAQLPNELQSLLQARHHDTYQLPEFYNRVGARAGLTYYDAAERTWEVMHVLQQALPASEVRIIQENLPDPFIELFGNSIPGNPRPRP